MCWGKGMLYAYYLIWRVLSLLQSQPVLFLEFWNFNLECAETRTWMAPKHISFKDVGWSQPLLASCLSWVCFRLFVVTKLEPIFIPIYQNIAEESQMRSTPWILTLLFGWWGPWWKIPLWKKRIFSYSWCFEDAKRRPSQLRPSELWFSRWYNS